MSNPTPTVWTVERYVLAAIVLAAIIAVLLVALQTFGITLPGFVVTILWILFAAVVCVVAVKLLARLF